MADAEHSKEKTAELVASLGRREQAALLAEALLREFIHRKGFATTLATFDEESPRSSTTISSRALMRQLLMLPITGEDGRSYLQRVRAQQTPPPPTASDADEKDARRAKKAKAKAPAAPPPPTFMDELCSYRLELRAQEIASGAATSTSTPSASSQVEVSEEELNARLAEHRRLREEVEAKMAEYREWIAEKDERKAKRREKKHKKKSRKHHKDADTNGNKASSSSYTRKTLSPGEELVSSGSSSSSARSDDDDDDVNEDVAGRAFNSRVPVGSGWAPPGGSAAWPTGGAPTSLLFGSGGALHAPPPPALMHPAGGAGSCSPPAGSLTSHPSYDFGTNAMMGALPDRSEITEAWKPGGSGLSTPRGSTTTNNNGHTPHHMQDSPGASWTMDDRTPPKFNYDRGAQPTSSAVARRGGGVGFEDVSASSPILSGGMRGASFQNSASGGSFSAGGLATPLTATRTGSPGGGGAKHNTRRQGIGFRTNSASFGGSGGSIADLMPESPILTSTTSGGTNNNNNNNNNNGNNTAGAGSGRKSRRVTLLIN